MWVVVCSWYCSSSHWVSRVPHQFQFYQQGDWVIVHQLLASVEGHGCASGQREAQRMKQHFLTTRREDSPGHTQHPEKSNSIRSEEEHRRNATKISRKDRQQVYAWITRDLWPCKKTCSDVSFCEDKWKDFGGKKRLLDYDIGNAQQHSLLHGPGPHKRSSRQSWRVSMHKNKLHTDRQNEQHVSWRLLIPQKKIHEKALGAPQNATGLEEGQITIHFFHHFCIASGKRRPQFARWVGLH